MQRSDSRHSMLPARTRLMRRAGSSIQILIVMAVAAISRSPDKSDHGCASAVAGVSDTSTLDDASAAISPVVVGWSKNCRQTSITSDIDRQSPQAARTASFGGILRARGLKAFSQGRTFTLLLEIVG